MRSLDEQFQSALPRGERLCLSVSKSGIPYFNPRSHEGSDLIPFKDHRNKGISIRAPTRGATLWKNIYMLPGQISIRAPTRGATGTQWKSTAITTDFNPRSHEGSDIIPSVYIYPLSYFNPRSHEGSDINFHQKVLFSLSKNCLIHLFFITNFLN